MKKTKKQALADLIEAATEAYEWLENAPEGTDQWERAIKLKKALDFYTIRWTQFSYPTPQVYKE